MHLRYTLLLGRGIKVCSPQKGGGLVAYPRIDGIYRLPGEVGGQRISTRSFDDVDSVFFEDIDMVRFESVLEKGSTVVFEKYIKLGWGWGSALLSLEQKMMKVAETSPTGVASPSNPQKGIHLLRCFVRKNAPLASEPPCIFVQLCEPRLECEDRLA